MKQSLTRQLGSSLAEVLVAIALTGVMLPAFAEAVLTSEAARPSSSQNVQALSLEREAEEAVRVAREASWSNVATDGTYHPVISGNTWSLASGPEIINSFTRQIVISSVQRDGSGAITASGTADPSTKHVVITESWAKPIPGSISTDTYLSRWQSEASWTQTTQADFDAGTYNNTVSFANGDGSVHLAGKGNGISWATPAQVGTFNLSGTTDANDIYVDSSTSRAYIVNGAALTILDVSDPTNPAQLGSFNAGVQVNGVYVSGNYAYLASTNNTAELTVVNVTNPAAPSQASTLNLGDTADATSIYVSGGYAYIGKVLSSTSGINEFYVVNVSNPVAPSLTGSLNLTGTVNSVYGNGNYIYLATAVTTAELTIVNVTNKSAPVIAGSYNAAGTAVANDVFFGGFYVYLAESNNTSGPELFILDASNPASVSLVGSYEMGADIYGVYVSGSEAFLASSKSNWQFTVLDLSTISSPVLEGRKSVTTPNDIYVTNDTAYLADTSNTTELVIMQGTLDTTGRAASGTYESPTFDAGQSVGFNYLTMALTVPAGTTLTIQIAVNNDNTTWNYVGPDGTPFTQYSASGTIPLVKAAGRYFRYEASFDTTNVNQVNPSLDNVSLLYSP